MGRGINAPRFDTVWEWLAGVGTIWCICLLMSSSIRQAWGIFVMQTARTALSRWLLSASLVVLVFEVLCITLIYGPDYVFFRVAWSWLYYFCLTILLLADIEMLSKFGVMTTWLTPNFVRRFRYISLISQFVCQFPFFVRFIVFVDQTDDIWIAKYYYLAGNGWAVLAIIYDIWQSIYLVTLIGRAIIRQAHEKGEHSREDHATKLLKRCIILVLFKMTIMFAAVALNIMAFPYETSSEPGSLKHRIGKAWADIATAMVGFHIIISAEMLNGIRHMTIGPKSTTFDAGDGTETSSVSFSPASPTLEAGSDHHKRHHHAKDLRRNRGEQQRDGNGQTRQADVQESSFQWVKKKVSLSNVAVKSNVGTRTSIAARYTHGTIAGLGGGGGGGVDGNRDGEGHSGVGGGLGTVHEGTSAHSVGHSSVHSPPEQ